MRNPCGGPKIGRLKRRADFLHVAKGGRWHGRALSLQVTPREGEFQTDADAAVRFGFTLTKKVGNAVVRNRARRRLKEALRLAPDLPAKAGHDYVIVGRLDAIRLSFADLQNEIARGIAAIRDGSAKRGGTRRGAQRTRPET